MMIRQYIRKPLSIAAVALPVLAFVAHAQSAPRDARSIIASAAATELEADRTDHTAFIYRDHDIQESKDTLYHVCETPEGNLKRKLEDHGKPISAEERQADDAAMLKLVHDEAMKSKQRKDNSHDDAQAEEMLKILPTAFLWTIVSEQGDLITLDFKPDPAFQAPNMEARVFGSMEGRVVVAKGDNRIRSMSGRMIRDVKIMGGMLGGLHKGGTFQVERREVIPHHWQVTELHVHIQGKVFFATIGSQEDETRTDFKASPAENLKQAYDILNPPTK